MITPYLWRSMLYVPANRPSRLQKCARYGADALILDLEDSVPDSEKAESRLLLKQALKEPIWDSAELYGSNGGSERVDLFVRINAMRTRYWREDLEAVIPEEIFGLKVPKVEEPAKVKSWIMQYPASKRHPVLKKEGRNSCSPSKRRKDCSSFLQYARPAPA